MIPIKHRLTSIFTQAIQTAFPISDSANIEYSKQADLICKSPPQIYEKYRKEQVCFGLFNSREIADSIFVNVDRDYSIKRVEVSGMGDLKIFLNNEFLYESMLDLYNSERIYTQEIEGMDYLVIMERLRDVNLEGSIMKDKYHADCYKQIVEAMGGKCKILTYLDDGMIHREIEQKRVKVIVPTYFTQVSKYMTNPSCIVPSGDLLFNLSHHKNVTYEQLAQQIYKSLKDLPYPSQQLVLNNSLRYEILKNDISNTIYITPSSLLCLSKQSWLGIFKILTYLQSKSLSYNLEPSPDLLNNEQYRHLILHILQYKDIIHDSLAQFSSKQIIQWLNILIEYLVVLDHNEQNEISAIVLKCSFIVIKDCFKVLGIQHTF